MKIELRIHTTERTYVPDETNPETPVVVVGLQPLIFTPEEYAELIKHTTEHAFNAEIKAQETKK